ncbi:MAG: hypothetical protein WD623_16905 [Marinobacter sp.]|uniref:hypothetical protein n=1 Tax=Marinobacter sp. TaxID=50741 RepID=UPI0034A089B3
MATMTQSENVQVKAQATQAAFDPPEHGEGRPFISAGQYRLHYSDHKWDTILGTSIQVDGGPWRIGGSLRPARDMQDTALLEFDRASSAIAKVKANPDLTVEAKSRQAREAVEGYYTAINGIAQKLAESMASLADAAPSVFSMVKPLEKDNVGAHLMDQELRQYIRSAAPNDRQAVTLAAARGDQPELVSAILRAPAILSGISENARESMRRAGIMANYSKELRELRAVLMIRNDVARTAISGLQTLAAIHPGAADIKIKAGSWRSDEGTERLAAWLDEFRALSAA